MPDQPMTPAKLRELAPILQMGNMYALADIGEKDDRITNAIADVLAAADAWEADVKYKCHLEEECKTAEETCDYLHKRLEAVENEAVTLRLNLRNAELDAALMEKTATGCLAIRAHLHDFQHQYHDGLGVQVVAIARNAANLYLPWNLAVAVGELVQKAIEGVDWLSDDHGCTWEMKHE